MGKSLREIAQQIKGINKQVQLIYAFNGTGKTRLSREFKNLVAPKSINDLAETVPLKILYYNAFTEDLFYWDNDLKLDADPKLKIQPNSFTEWVLEDQGQDRNIIANFQHYTNKKLSPRFSEDFSEVSFSLTSGDDKSSGNIKISKGEESNFIWSVFYSLLEQVIEVLNVPEPDDRETNQFDQLEYVFIDDPVSSLDENHLIELAADLARLIKTSKSSLKFIVTTHNPLFYNVLHNEFKNEKFRKHHLKKQEDGEFELMQQAHDSPFSYHLYLKTELEKAILTGKVNKFHFNFLRNILEKTSTFLGYQNWTELLPPSKNGRINPYEARIINISSHSKHAGEETTELTDNDKRVLAFIMEKVNETFRFKSNPS